ncbi:hypothetical protein PIB30_050281 [Stylosanthes scabra]|uniref:Reticulon-like protein n=1 Tax=Stylosanthes scabra TaxID=79078 RepID=A0ABU6VJ63_9FABA|nr:hypothetical protein [Stylosanthes scabra]
MSAEPEPVMPAEPQPEAESQAYMTTPPSHSSSEYLNENVVKDVVLWRRKKLNATILILETAAWVFMQLYQFKFITLISWLAIFLLASIFLYANLTTLVGKEAPHYLSRFEVTEETAMGMAHSVRAWIEEAIRLLLWVGAEKEWHVFAGVEVGLLLLSYVGTFMDLLTFLYIGTIVSMTVPVAYVKNEDKIQRLMNWIRERCNKSYQVLDEKAIQKIKTKVMNGKDKKTE